MSPFKYLGLILGFKNIKKIYIEENGKDKSIFLSRRFIGAVITFASTIFTALYGITLDPEKLTSIIDAIENIAKIIPILYGALLSLKGFWDTYIGPMLLLNEKDTLKNEKDDEITNTNKIN